jgi:hypothetical protein
MKAALLTLVTVVCACAARAPQRPTLAAFSEFVRPDPFGGIVAPDRQSGAAPLRAISLRAARAGYASFHLAVNLPETGEYSLTLESPGSGIQAEVYREWFHFTEPDKSYYPDALVPVKLPYRSRLPEPDNRIEKQTAQAFWIDLWIPADAKPWVYHFDAKLETPRGRATLPIELRVVSVVIPKDDVVAMDHNSYGTGLAQAPYLSDAFFAQIHASHRIFYEHRGVFHSLGYGHAGKVRPEFAPELEGSGRNKHIKSWDLFDRHYGPLLDGSAFAATHRGPKPIPYMYLPINPEWPASYLWWGEPGYEAEFRNVVSAMESHFREKGWTHTVLEVFFNHKVRYKGFPWDGDETRSEDDLPFLAQYAELVKKSIPAGTPVQFRLRADVSWMMEEEFKKLAGVVTFWVAGGSTLSWYRDAPKMLKERGDTVFIYGGTPVVSKVSTEMGLNPLKAWLLGVDGYVHWLSDSPGRDPWFHFGGGDTALVYPGAKFGVAGPISSVRLKLERNCVQDLTLLASFTGRRPVETLKGEVAQRYNGTTLDDWWIPRPALADRPVLEWDNANMEDIDGPKNARLAKVDSAAWEKVRQYIFGLAAEVSQ